MAAREPRSAERSFSTIDRLFFATMSTTTPGSSPLPVPGDTPAPMGPARPRRRWIVPVAAAAVVAIVIVGTLFATGMLHLGSSTPPAPTDLTFSQAESAAQSSSASVAGGPWYPVLGAAIVTPVAALEPATNLSAALGVANCTFLWPNGEPENIALPATHPSAAIGTSAYWSVSLKNASNGLLVETVAQGVAAPLVKLGGARCAGFAAFLASFPSGVVDSPSAIKAASAVGGSAFLAEHPNATELWLAVGGISVDGLTSTPDWYLEYSSCAIGAPPTSQGDVFNATVGGLSGVVTAHANGTADCGLTTSEGGSLAVPAPGVGALARKMI